MKHISHTQTLLLAALLILLSLSPLSARGNKEAAPQETTLKGDIDTSSVEQSMNETSPEPSADGSLQFLTLSIYGDQINQDLFASSDITMLNVWGTYCSPCIREMPDLGDINREYADKGFQIVGIVIDGYSADEEKFREQIGMAQAIVDYTKADYTHLLPVSYELAQAYLADIQVVPTTFFVDSKGKIIGKSLEGSRSKEDWLSVIDGVIAEYGTN